MLKYVEYYLLILSYWLIPSHIYRLETCSGDPITPIDYFPTWNDFSGVL